MKKFIAKGRLLLVAAVALLLVLSLLAGCGTDGEAEDRNERNLPTVVVGVDHYPPFSYVNENGRMVGIDVELAREAFTRMGYYPKFDIIEWERKDTLLHNHEIDCVWSSFSMAGRKEKYQWAGPYMVSKQVVAVTKRSNIHRLRDLEGKIVGVQTTTKPEELFLNYKSNGLPHVKFLYSMEDRELIYALLGKGYVDAIAAHESAIEQYKHDYNVDYRILDEPLVKTGIGVAFDKNDKRDLAKKLDKTLQEMHQDGTVKKIILQYLDDADKYLEVESLEK